MALHTIGAPPARANDWDTIEDLGRHILRLTALLRAAINTGANEREDEAWLISIAHDEAEAASARFTLWSNPEEAK